MQQETLMGKLGKREERDGELRKDETKPSVRCGEVRGFRQRAGVLGVRVSRKSVQIYFIPPQDGTLPFN